MRRLFNYIPEGGGPKVIDPASQPHQEIYYSGLTGFNPATDNQLLVSWDDQSGNSRTLNGVIPGASAPLTHTTGQGLTSGVGCIELVASGSPRGKRRVLLPTFPTTRGSTQYILAKMTTNTAQVWVPAYWPIGGNNGPILCWQGGGYNGGGGNVWNGNNVPAGNMCLMINSVGYDVGLATVSGQWELWTVVSTTANHHLVYRNGSLVRDVVTATYQLTDEIDVGAFPSLNPVQSGRLAMYDFLTDQHSAGIVAGIKAWVSSHYGVP